MPVFGKRSRKNLATCHEDLQRLFSDVINSVDVAVICGHRGKLEQEQALEAGLSKLAWPKSKHNKEPSLAVDVAPYPINWSDTKRFDNLALVVKAAAKRLGIKVVWGGDWKSLKDRPHYELV